MAGIRINWQRVTVFAAAFIVSVACFYKVVVPKAIRYPVQAVRYYDFYQNIRDTLSIIPDGASVTATTFYTMYLSQRETLYDVRYCSLEHMLKTQYVVLRISADSDFKMYAVNGEGNGFENLVNLLEENGYEPYKSIGDTLVIYRKK